MTNSIYESLEHLELPNKYDKISEANLAEQLRNALDVRVNDVYQNVSKILLDYAGKGYCDMRIFVPINPSIPGTIYCDFFKGNYTGRLDNQYNGFKDDFFIQRLTKKFKENGVHIAVYPATYEKHNVRVDGGIVLVCKFDKHSGKCSII